MIKISICLSDLPKEKITTAGNGKKYVDLVVSERREPSKYGDTHTIYVPQSKEEREGNTPRVFVGKGTEYRSF